MSGMEKRRRPGGRTGRTTETVHAAVAALLSEMSPGEITLPMVAERAGTAATSLYRRWGDVRALLIEAAVARLVRDHPLADTGSLRGDLAHWATAVATSLASPDSSVFLRIQLGFANSSTKTLPAMAPRLRQIGELLERARARGEATPHLLQVTDHLLGPLYMRALFGAPADTATAVGFVDDVLELTRARQEP